MEISIDVLVKCRDGRCGYCLQILLNPMTHRVMHLVVKENELHGAQRLVPIDWILETVPTVIHLRCTKAQFATLDEFIELGRDQLSMPNYAYVPSDSARPSSDAEILARPMRRELPLLGALAISASTRVQAKDGDLGRIAELLIDWRYAQIAHLVMQQGYLGRIRRVLVPASEIERIEEQVIQLKMNMQAVDALPATPWGRKGSE